jgi:hypothetical protein
MKVTLYLTTSCVNSMVERLGGCQFERRLYHDRVKTTMLTYM